MPCLPQGENGVTKTGGPRKKEAAAPARSRRMRQVSELLPEIGGAAFRRFGFVQSSIVSRWREIVGPRYAVVSSPESIRFPPGKKSGGVLTLVVEGAHAPMMQHVAPAIVERVNRFFGYPAVNRISFRQGIVQAEKARARPEPSLRPIPAELGDSLREVADPELRACLESLARGLSSGEVTPVVTMIPVVGRIGGERKR
nr:DciA family protein [Sphingosinicella sp. CPCC 101087]